MTHAGTGDDAWHELQSHTWDVVLLDWWLPGQDGLTLLQRFRANGGTAPVLFLTARDAVPDRVRGLDAGADDYLCKPFSFEELLVRVRALARRPGGGAGTVLRHADVAVDLATHRAERRPTARTHRQGTGAARLLPAASRRSLIANAHLRTSLGRALRRHIEHSRSSRHGIAAQARGHGPRLIHTLRGRGYLCGDARGAE